MLPLEIDLGPLLPEHLSELFAGIGLALIVWFVVAKKVVPVFEKTNATSGKLLTVRSTSFCIVWDWLNEVLGMRMACMAISFSSSVGINSRPSDIKTKPAATNAAKAIKATFNGCATAPRNAGI